MLGFEGPKKTTPPVEKTDGAEVSNVVPMTAADAKTEGGSYMIRDNAGNVVRAASSPEEARKLQAEESENAREAA